MWMSDTSTISFNEHFSALTDTRESPSTDRAWQQAGTAPSFQTLLPSWPLLQTKLGPTAFICQGLPLRFQYNWNFCSMGRLDFYILTAWCPLEFAHWNTPILAFFSFYSCWIATPHSSHITESKSPFTAGDTDSSFRFLEKRRLLQEPFNI